MNVYAFDFFGTLTAHENVRELARRLHTEGHEIHVVSAILAGHPYDTDAVYGMMLEKLNVPFTKIHRLHHQSDADVAPLKVATLLQIKPHGFWDDDNRNVVAAIRAGIPSCCVDGGAIDLQSVLTPDIERKPPVALELLYRTALRATEADTLSPSDIVEHLPLLRELAMKCEHVTEFGCRRGNGSTVALLAGQPSTFITYDINPYAIVSQQIADLISMAGRTQFQPRVGDTLKINIEPTDLLFIDSLHTARQLRDELYRHALPPLNNVRRYIAFHDTHTFGLVSEDGSQPGLRAAIGDFQRNSFPLWGLKYDWSNNNGLVVLERVDVSNSPGVTPDAPHPQFK